MFITTFIKEKFYRRKVLQRKLFIKEKIQEFFFKGNKFTKEKFKRKLL